MQSTQQQKTNKLIKLNRQLYDARPALLDTCIGLEMKTVYVDKCPVIRAASRFKMQLKQFQSLWRFLIVFRPGAKLQYLNLMRPLPFNLIRAQKLLWKTGVT